MTAFYRALVLLVCPAIGFAETTDINIQTPLQFDIQKQEYHRDIEVLINKEKLKVLGFFGDSVTVAKKTSPGIAGAVSASNFKDTLPLTVTGIKKGWVSVKTKNGLNFIYTLSLADVVLSHDVFLFKKLSLKP